MRKFGIVLLGLVLAAPVFAASSTDEVFTGVPSTGTPSRTNDCPGTIIWDTGMFDEYTPPTGCSSAGSAGCFVNAINDGAFPEDGRRIADEFISDGAGSAITHVKIWARYNAQGYDYHAITPGSLHGFCVKFYDAMDEPPWCPDGTIAGETAIGPIVYSQYVGTGGFIEYEITTGLVRNFNYCITLPVAFVPAPSHVYWVSVSADFDFVSFGGGVTQWFWRMYPGLGYNPYCEASWWDLWNTPETNWNAISVAIALPCWAGWDASFVLYSAYTPPPMGACCFPDGSFQMTFEADCIAPAVWHGDWTCDPNQCPQPPNPTESKTWGQIKHDFR